MNFLAHAVTAAPRDARPGFAVGAVLPDLRNLGGPDPAAPRDRAVAAGVAHHHAADEAFHGSAAFLDLLADGRARLEADGVARGPARGAAHVGIELLLDGVLWEDRAARDLWHRVLDDGDGLDWGEGGPEWRRLRGRLPGADLPAGYARPDFVGDRIRRMLARRPRLALDAPAAAAVTRWLADHAAPAVRTAAPDLLATARH